MSAIERLRSLSNEVERGRSALGRLPRVLTDATDQALQELGRGVPNVAIVAVGGYGRRQQCLHSDIDVLILYRGGIPDVAPILYPLWDAKFKVGHAVRTVKECTIAGRENVQTLTGLLDARLVTGDIDLFRLLVREVRGLVASMGAGLRAELAAEELAAIEAEPYGSLTPDVKTSRGHLRSLQRVHWERRRQSLSGSGTLRESADERAARVHLLAVRNALHHVADRPQDRLEVDLREPVARQLEMTVPELMHSLRETVAVVEDASLSAFESEFERRADPVAEAGRRIFWAMRRRSSLAEGSDVLATAVAGLSSPGLAALHRAGDAKPATWTPADVDRLFQIVAGGNAGRRVWNALWRSGWLRRELPEWEAVVGAPQLAAIHAHPVDGHLFRTVDEVLALVDSNDVARRSAIDALGGPELPVWAALFHDIGKGRPGDHSEVGAELVATIGERLNLPGARLLEQAVRHHLLLPEVATRRDLEDPDVISSVVDAVGDPQLLRLLYVISAADGIATGTGSWTPWRADLVDRLFRRVAERMGTDGHAISEESAHSDLAVRLELERDVVSSHVSGMPDGYLLRYSDEAIALHAQLAADSLSPGEVRHGMLAGGELVTAIVVSRDVRGLAARIAGACAQASLSILEGRFEHRTDGVAIDTFVVADARGASVGPARLERAFSNLSGPLVPPSGALTAVSVRALDGGRIVEVRGDDQPGFLADVCAALAELGHDIDLAKLDTRAGRVVDVFYVDPPLQSGEALIGLLGSADH